MIYLKEFATAQDYNAVKDNLPTPNVSLITDGSEVKYLKGTTPPTPVEHEYVDLGLPSGTLWATMNVGANSMTDYGNYYQYGKGAAQYASTSGQSDYSGTEDPLATSADTATQVWGDGWHMPTLTQVTELIANTTYEWTTIDGVNGAKFTAKDGSDKYIFLPAGGHYSSDGKNTDVGGTGYYWSSSPDSDPDYADWCSFWLNMSSVNKSTKSDSRSYGLTVRPVKDV